MNTDTLAAEQDKGMLQITFIQKQVNAQSVYLPLQLDDVQNLQMCICGKKKKSK